MSQIENWKANLAECKLTLDEYEMRLRQIAERETQARDGLELVGLDKGTTAAYARRTFQIALEECAEDREKFEDGVAGVKRKISALEGYLREAAAGVKADERQRRIDILLRKIGDVRAVV